MLSASDCLFSGGLYKWRPTDLNNVTFLLNTRTSLTVCALTRGLTLGIHDYFLSTNSPHFFPASVGLRAQT